MLARRMERPIFRLWLLVCAFVLNARADDELPEIHDVPTVVSPAGDTVVTSGSLPVLIRLPKDMRFHRAQVYVDGRLVERASPVVRTRWWAGKGVDMMARIRTDELSPGTHELRVDFEPTRDARLKREPNVSGMTQSVTTAFDLSPRGPRVLFRAVDGDGAARSARFQLFDSEGQPVPIGNPSDADADPSGRDSPRTSLFAGPDGAGEYLLPGSYQVLASGGIRDAVSDRQLEVSEAAEVVFEIPRVVFTPGEVTADFHVHTAMSSDSFIPDADRFLGLNAAGVEVAVITDHNRVRDPGPPIRAAGLAGEIEGVAGAELRLGAAGESVGHANAFPLDPRQRAPTAGDIAPARAFEHWREHHESHPPDGFTGPLFIQLNHPRGIQFKPDKKHRWEVHSIFEELRFNPKVPIREQPDQRLRARDSQGRSFLDVDAIEVLNRFSVEGWKAVRSDWFELLNRGHTLIGTGNADSHTSQLEPAGFPVNLVTVVGEGLEGFWKGLANGAVRVSSGPLVSLTVSGRDASVGPSKVPAHLGALVRADMRVDHADWVDVPEVRLVMNGDVIFRESLTQEGPRDWRVHLWVDADSWIIAEAGWPLDREDRPEGTTYAKVANGHVPIGFTNPVFMDADGDGEWIPTEGREGPAPR